MPRETMEILAVWKERPSLFGDGLMQWVAEATGPDGPQRVRESPAFPLDDRFVTENDSDNQSPFIRIVRDEMDEEQRTVVETMHAEFVASLERDGWVQTGRGRDWYDLHFARSVSP